MSSCLSCSYLLLWTSFEAWTAALVEEINNKTEITWVSSSTMQISMGHYNRDDLQQQSLALWMAIKIWSSTVGKWPCLWLVRKRQRRGSLSKSDTQDGQIDITFTTSKLSDEWLLMRSRSRTFRELLDHMNKLNKYWTKIPSITGIFQWKTLRYHL